MRILGRGVSKTGKMDPTEYRCVIKYLLKKQMTAQQIFEDMSKTLGDDCPSRATICRWTREFKRGRKSVEDDHRSGRPVDYTDDETVARVHELVMNDRRVTIPHLAKMIGCSLNTISRILHDKIGMTKLSARWVPRMLTKEQKALRATTSRALLSRMMLDKPGFLGRIVTQDETWVHHFEPESKMQSKAWRHVGSPPPRKFRVQGSSRKVMASVFWDAEGIIMIDYLPQGHTITGLYYAQELRRLREEIKSKRRGKLRRGVLLLQDNAPAHTSRVAMAAAAECGFEILPHPPYSPDLAPSDYHLFRKLKSRIRGRRFDDDNDVMVAVDEVLMGFPSEFYLEGIATLEHRWNKCIEVGGDYVEK